MPLLIENCLSWAQNLLNTPSGTIIAGIGVTLQYTLISVSLGLFFGTILALLKVGPYKSITWAAQFYTSIFRGTPLLLQLTLVYFATPSLTGYKITILEAGILAFSFNSAAYVSETIRAGIRAVDKGQFEAAHALGIPYALTMRDIILPQSLRNILPSLVNEVINMLKESALISIIGGADIMYRAGRVAAEHYTYFGPLLVAGACYYTMVLLLTIAGSYLERKLRIQELGA